jgi:hypothetical protein
MKELQGSASDTVSSPLSDCMRLLTAVDDYPRWNPKLVTEVTVLERDATAQVTRAQVKLTYAMMGSTPREFDLTMAVAIQQPGTVRLARVPHEANDQQRFEVEWNCEQAASGTLLRVSLGATLPVPRFLPLGMVAEGVARAFMGNAVHELSQ